MYRPTPTQPTQVKVSRPPVLRKDAMGTFESRLRWNARWRWLGPTLVVLVVALAVVAWIAMDRRAGAGAEQARAEGLARLALDDASSIDEAAARLDQALQRAPGLAAAAADRALVDLMRAGALADDAETEAQETSARGSRVQAAALTSSAAEALRRLEREGKAPVEVGRALAIAAALRGEGAEVQRQAAAGGAGDPWLALAQGLLNARSPDRSRRERSVGALQLVVSRHPELLHARWRLAVALTSLGRREEALAAVDSLLGANARHERGKALRAELTRPPPPAATPAAQEREPMVKSVAPQRKPLAQPSAPAVAPALPPPAPEQQARTAARAEPLGGRGGAADAGAADSAPEAADSAPAPLVPLPPRLWPAAVPEPHPVAGDR